MCALFPSFTMEKVPSSEESKETHWSLVSALHEIRDKTDAFHPVEYSAYRLVIHRLKELHPA